MSGLGLTTTLVCWFKWDFYRWLKERRIHCGLTLPSVTYRQGLPVGLRFIITANQWAEPHVMGRPALSLVGLRAKKPQAFYSPHTHIHTTSANTATMQTKPSHVWKYRITNSQRVNGHVQHSLHTKVHRGRTAAHTLLKHKEPAVAQRTVQIKQQSDE